MYKLIQEAKTFMYSASSTFSVSNLLELALGSIVSTPLTHAHHPSIVDPSANVKKSNLHASPKPTSSKQEEEGASSRSGNAIMGVGRESAIVCTLPTRYIIILTSRIRVQNHERFSYLSVHRLFTPTNSEHQLTTL